MSPASSLGRPRRPVSASGGSDRRLLIQTVMRTARVWPRATWATPPPARDVPLGQVRGSFGSTSITGSSVFTYTTGFVPPGTRLVVGFIAAVRSAVPLDLSLPNPIRVRSRRRPAQCAQHLSHHAPGHRGSSRRRGATQRHFFTVPPSDTPRSQMAARNAAAQPGHYPLIILSHNGCHIEAPGGSAAVLGRGCRSGTRRLRCGQIGADWARQNTVQGLMQASDAIVIV
jgi:hypothetical protein